LTARADATVLSLERLVLFAFGNALGAKGRHQRAEVCGAGIPYHPQQV
jgi:hypothetical protein